MRHFWLLCLAAVATAALCFTSLASARTCPGGFTHAIISGAQKCLHAGEYCARSASSQYRRYHYVCVNVRGTYRLEHS